MSKARKNNAREQRRREMRGSYPNSTKQSAGSVGTNVIRRVRNIAKPLKR